jgi:hypothetical protein
MMIFAYGNNRQLTTDEKTAVKKSALDKSIAGLQITIRDMDLINVKVTVDVKYRDSYTNSVMEGLIKTAITKYLSPEGFVETKGPGGSEGFTQSDLAAVIQRIPGVLYVDSVAFVRADTAPMTTTSSSGTLHSLLYEITTGTNAGNVNFLAKGLLPKVTNDANHLIVNLTAVAAS